MKLQKDTKVHGRWYDDACGTAFALELVGERWSLLIIRELLLGPRRFSDLRATLPGISAKVLTERLSTLADANVLTRHKLPPPAASQVYELTEWGYSAETIIQELGRWAATSPLHDPTLPLSAVSFMISLRTMFDRGRAGNWSAMIGFAIGEDRFVASLANGALPIVRGESDGTDAVFIAAEAPQLAAVFYGKQPADAVGASIEGDAEVAARFIDLFHLPR
ncbi:winged helix-turn-helix transcriptional regulator [Alteriqipengyuania lutimaris]|uniref:Transcriptional regulator n=1 Tax=Alteriqipengyuania lutimaris TaxID=1538146 RepID=A0A395LLB9_9SPHN|nr:helix-turn-helix domain-containing protein [Alteriqipengyuania lutimaris]MBB3033220.1 DNA-binding HxlR family transcriptional regulator [Alteriqipengyuania lutimaris]RDS77732.1 transcriptional regulator [Alteriqipengyuania lutimaris]